MNPTRYILTRSCLQEGSMRLLKFNEPYFPQSGPAQFVDDRGKEHEVLVDREKMQVTGLGPIYHDYNLSVNDVLMITPLTPGRYEVAAVVKPYSTPRSRNRRGEGRFGEARPGERRERVNERVGERRSDSRPDPRDRDARNEAGRAEGPRNDSPTPSVREVRGAPTQNLSTPLPSARRPRQGPSGGGGRNLSGLGEERRPDEVPSARPQPIAPAFAPQRPPGRPDLVPLTPAPLGSFGLTERGELEEGQQPVSQEAHSSQSPSLSETVRPSLGIEDQLVEFARLVGYRFTLLGDGLVRLNADLGENHGYSVLLATEPLATTSPIWMSGEDDHRALITGEEERVPGLSRLTREALVALTEHARLSPLGALDLRGYWRAGSLDLESAASVAEMVSRHLAQRGAFTYVLMTLSQQPAQSVVNLSDLAQRLGSGVSLDDMNTILETLSRPPFMALTLLPGGQFLLRCSVADLLADLSDYAQGVRRRLRSE